MIRLRIRELAEEKGISIYRLSQAASVDYKTVKRLWYAPSSHTTTKTLAKIADALAVHTADLIEYTA